MSTFGIENYDVRGIQDMISSSLAVYKLPTGEIKDLLKFDSTFTLNPYDDKTLTIDNKKVVSKILNYSRKRKPFSFFSVKSGDRKPELIQINKAEYIVNCISFYAGIILLCYHLEPPKTFYINFIIFSESTSVIYNHRNYVAVSIISNRVKIIFGDQSHTLKESFAINTWICIAVSGTTIYLDGEINSKFESTPSYPIEPRSKPSQLGSVNSSFAIGFMSYFPIIHDAAVIRKFAEFFRRR